MPFVELPGASLYYEVHGKSGPWLVFVHGAGGNHLSWWQQVPAFASRHRCVVLAQRGWGRSPAATPDPASFASDLTALLDHLDVDRAALVGQSMGGWSVVGCALVAPARVSHLVLTGTIAGLSDDAMLAELARIHAPGRPFDPHLALAPDFPAREPARTFLYDAIAGLNPPPPPTFLAALVGLRYAARAPALTMPVHFIAGAHDQLFPPALVRRAHAMVPGAAFELVPDAGHSVYFETPDTFNRLLRTALASDAPPWG